MRKGPVASAAAVAAMLACARVLDIDDVTYDGDGRVDAPIGDGASEGGSPVDASVVDSVIKCESPPLCVAAKEICCMTTVGGVEDKCLPRSTLAGADTCDVDGAHGFVIECDRPADCAAQGHPGWVCCLHPDTVYTSFGSSHCVPPGDCAVNIMCDPTSPGDCPADLPRCISPTLSNLSRYSVCCPLKDGAVENCP
jgi:hypothetical protein